MNRRDYFGRLGIRLVPDPPRLDYLGALGRLLTWAFALGLVYLFWYGLWQILKLIWRAL